MTPEQVKELENIYETVHSKGWVLLMKDVEDKLTSIKDETLNPSVQTEVWRVAQGRALVYRELLSLPAMIDHTLTQLTEDAQELKDEQASDL